MAKPHNQPTTNSAPKGIDWNQAFIDYCTLDFATMSLPSYQDIADKYGVSKRMVEKIGKRNDWAKVRQELGKKKVEEYKANLSELQDEANWRHGETWRLLQKSIRIEISELVETQMRIRANAANASKEDIKRLNYLSSKLEELSKALKEAVNGERVTLMLYTDVSKQDGSTQLSFDKLDKSEIEAMDAFMAKNQARIHNSSQNVQLKNDEQPNPNGQEAVQPQEAPANSNPPVSS